MSTSTRQPIVAQAVSDAVVTGSMLTSVRVAERTGSTNADLLAAAAGGAAAGAVLVAEEQTSGRGRLDRSWHSEPGAALLFSVLLRPGRIPPASRGWLPLLTGVAVAGALRSVTGLDISLKWPNDVLCGDAKLAGILAEQAGGAVVIGVGLNVTAGRDELPSAQATSLQLAGAADPDRTRLLIAILRELERWYLRFEQAVEPGDAIGSGLRAEYLRCCGTVGRQVRVELPGGTFLAGRASDVNGVGQLVVDSGTEETAVSAGDVVHVRPRG